MIRRPFVPFPAALGDVLRPKDPRAPAMRLRCKRGVENLVGTWIPRGRSPEVAWHILSVLARESVERLRFWTGAQMTSRVLGGLVQDLRRRAAGETFRPLLSAEAPPEAIDQAQGLFAEICAGWPLSSPKPGPLAWALLVATLEECWARLGVAAAAELASCALGEILPRTPEPPRPIGEARL